MEGNCGVTDENKKEQRGNVEWEFRMDERRKKIWQDYGSMIDNERL